jgi:hypothetical protein
MGVSELLTIVNSEISDYLASLPDNSFTGVLSDGPYGLGITQNRRVGGFHWDDSSICFQPQFWESIRRVTIPGGLLAAWGHSRTAHRQTMAIEQAGFRILENVMHIKPSGFNPGSRSIDAELEKLGHPVLAGEYAGFTTHIKGAHEPITIAANLQRRDSVIRTIANGGGGGLHTQPLMIPTTDASRERMPGRVSETAAWSVQRPAVKSKPHPSGRLPTNVVFSHSESCVDSHCGENCALAAIDSQGRHKYAGERASRFFSSLRYAPRAPADERPSIDGVSAPTVKSMEIATWIATLLGVRPGTTWLDPFGGSGALSEAVARLGGRVVYVEKEAEYCSLVRARFTRLDAKRQ